MTTNSTNPYLEFADNIARLRENAEGPFVAPETPCARHNLGLEHDPHTIYLVSTPVGHCPGVESM